MQAKNHGFSFLIKLLHKFADSIEHETSFLLSHSTDSLLTVSTNLVYTLSLLPRGGEITNSETLFSFEEITIVIIYRETVFLLYFDALPFHGSTKLVTMTKTSVQFYFAEGPFDNYVSLTSHLLLLTRFGENHSW